MELNVIEYGVAVNRTIYDQIVEQPVDLEITMPDYCPDIERVLKCRVCPRVVSKTITNSSLSMEINVAITIMYVNVENAICSYDYSVTLSKNTELPENAEGSHVIVIAKPSYINARAVSQRKIDIHGALSLKIKIEKICSNNVISDIEDDMILKRTMSSDATTPLITCEKNIMVEDEIELGQGKPSIQSFIRNDARAVVTDCKIISNKAVVKGELIISALYCPDDSSKPQTFETIEPFSQIIDMTGVGENCECNTVAEVIGLDLKPRTSITGETRIIVLSARICLTVSAFCTSEIPIIEDAYCTKYETEIKRDNVAFEKIISNISEHYLCKKSLDFEGSNIASVADMWCDSQVGNVRCEDKSLIAAGTVIICILAYDSDGTPMYFERPVDYEYRYELEVAPKSMRCDPQIECVASSYTLIGVAKIEVRVELNVTAAVFDINRKMLVTGIKIIDSVQKSKNHKEALVVYFAASGENVWDIAKKYNTTPKMIFETNAISEDKISAHKMLLIPSV